MPQKKVTGRAAIVRSYKAVPEVYRDKIGKVNETTAASMAMRARAMVPVRFGYLKSYIAHTFSERTGLAKVGIKKGRVVVPGRNGSALTKDGATAVSPAKYGRLVENGTSKAKAQPFMGPAARAERPAHLDRIKRIAPEISQAVKDAGGKGD